MTVDSPDLTSNGDALTTLFRVSSLLCRSTNPEPTLLEVLSSVCDYADAERGLIALSQGQEADSPEVVADWTRSGSSVRSSAIGTPASSATRWILQEDRNLSMAGGWGSDPRFADQAQQYLPGLEFLGLPIRSSAGLPVGSLEIQGDRTDLEKLTPLLEMVCLLIGQHSGACWQSQRKEVSEPAPDRRSFRFENLVGNTPAMRRVFTQIRQVAKWNTTVLVLGESGTGKELIANAIHFNSPRSRGPFIKLNCAALPDNLLESELFGHEKGAFTGALTKHTGRFEQAHRGTLFLDEIGEVSPSFQAKLLRVLQEGEYERLGGTHTLRVDVRVIAATNSDLEDQVEKGKFRQDLFYRLNVMPIETPPLRNRKEDIGELADHLLGKIAKHQGRELSFTDDALDVLCSHDWPGNVRELENALERAAVMTDLGLIDRETLALAGLESAPGAPNPEEGVLSAIDLRDETIDERERLLAALTRAGWVQAKAARLLGMTPRQVAYRVQILKIEIPRF